MKRQRARGGRLPLESGIRLFLWRGAVKLEQLYLDNRKNKFPVGAMMVLLLTEALVVMVKLEAVQFVGTQVVVLLQDKATGRIGP